MGRWSLALSLGLVVASRSALVFAAPFTIVMLPDTQHYSDAAQNYANFTAQTQWIVEHRLSHQLAFTTQVGDLVQNGAEGVDSNQTEWDRVSAAFGLLDGFAPAHPYVACAGNHDYDEVADKASALQSVVHFGPARYVPQGALVEP